MKKILTVSILLLSLNSMFGNVLPGHLEVEGLIFAPFTLQVNDKVPTAIFVYDGDKTVVSDNIGLILKLARMKLYFIDVRTASQEILQKIGTQSRILLFNVK